MNTTDKTVEQVTGEIEHLRHVIDRDRYIVAAVAGSIDRAISGYQWLLGEGRGPYEWDDDRFRDEFRHAVAAIEEAAKPLLHVAWDKTDCTRIEERVEAARLAAREVLNRPVPNRVMIAADLGLSCAYCTELRASPPPGNREAVLEALEAMLDHYGPAGSLRDTLEYPAGHPITLTRAAIRALKTTPNTTTADHGGEMERAVRAEREACAKLVEGWNGETADGNTFSIAEAIRTRHDTEGAGQ